MQNKFKAVPRESRVTYMAEWLTFGELPPELEAHAESVGLDQDDENRFLVWQMGGNFYYAPHMYCIKNAVAGYDALYTAPDGTRYGITDTRSDEWQITRLEVGYDQ